MSTNRFLHVTLGQVKSLTFTLGRSSVNPTTGFPVKCLQLQVPCQVLWKSTASLRSYVTAIANRHFVVKGNRLSDFVNHHFRYLHRDLPLQRPTEVPKAMKTLLASTRGIMRFSPKMMKLAALSGVMLTMRGVYNAHLVKLPLNDRKAFIIMSDAEALNSANVACDKRCSIVGVATETDANGNATDAKTKRIEFIMDRLRKMNPELDQYLIPGGRWKALALKDYRKNRFSAASSPGNGTVLFCTHVSDQLTDDEMALVVAHEMAHTVQKHSTESAGNNLFFKEFFRAALKPVIEKIPSFSLNAWFLEMEQNYEFADRWTQEREADEFGFQFACKACYDYRQFPGSMFKLGKIQQEAIAAYGELESSDEPESDEAGVTEPWDEELMYELYRSDFWCEVRHPAREQRVEKLKSREWLLKAEKWRLEKGCGPLLETQAMTVMPVTQKVDEFKDSNVSSTENVTES